MAYRFDVVGYMDWDNQRHSIPADESGNRPELDSLMDPEDAKGLWVRAVDEDDPEDLHMFWAYVYDPFEDWSEWYVYIGALMDQYGLELA